MKKKKSIIKPFAWVNPNAVQKWSEGSSGSNRNSEISKGSLGNGRIEDSTKNFPKFNCNSTANHLLEEAQI